MNATDYNFAQGMSSPGAARRDAMRRRGGFTLIEILVVIGIILILLGLVLGGMKVWGGQSAMKVTQARFGTLDSMLANMQAAGPNSYSNQTINPWLSTGSTLTLNGTTGQLVYVVGGNTISPAPAAAAYTDFTTVIDGLPSQRIATSTTRNEAILYTESVILNELQTIPGNSTVMGQMPTDAVVLPQNPPANTPTAPILLDGWGNPIIFVPAGGLWGVYSNQQPNYSSAATYSPGSEVIGSTYTTINGQEYYPIYTWITATSGNSKPPGGDWIQGIRSPDGRPFWASAGPDGNFQTGYDNVYSFQQ